MYMYYNTYAHIFIQSIWYYDAWINSVSFRYPNPYLIFQCVPYYIMSTDLVFIYIFFIVYLLGYFTLACFMYNWKVSTIQKANTEEFLFVECKIDHIKYISSSLSGTCYRTKYIIGTRNNFCCSINHRQ